MKLIHSSVFLFALLCLGVISARAAEKLVADYGGHAGFQSATWVAKDLRIFEKHGLDVEVIMITGAARSVAALLGNSTHFSTGSATGPLAAAVRGSDVRSSPLLTISSPMLLWLDPIFAVPMICAARESIFSTTADPMIWRCSWL